MNWPVALAYPGWMRKQAEANNTIRFRTTYWEKDMGISIWQLVIILAIVVLLFGTKKLRNVGGDLGGAIKSFRKAVKDGETSTSEAARLDEKGTDKADNVIEGEASREEKDKV